VFKQFTTTASTRRVHLERDESRAAYAHWGLND
jgi:hypothetical protein